METTKTILLRKPISYGKGDEAKTVSEITVREPHAGEYETAEKTAASYGLSIALIALLAGVPVDVIDDMYGSQIEEAESFIGAFGSALPAGPSPDEAEIDLVRPVKLTEEESALNVSRLHLVEPTNKQRRKASSAGGPFASSVALISAVANVPKGAIRAMCARDFLSAIAYFNGFQLRRQATSGD